MNPPSVEDVVRIAELHDPIIRNLQITQCYYDLSRAAAHVLDVGANWCTFATWASKQAGRTIRGEDMAGALEGHLAASPKMDVLLGAVARELQRLGVASDVRFVRDTIFRVVDPKGALDRASDAVARGNLKVFEEIGREFARFLAVVRGAGEAEERRIRTFCESFRAGEPPEGQGLLADAFRAYGEAIRSAEPLERAQLQFLANLSIGLHEQMRLQPEIAAALDAVIGDPKTARQQILKALFPGVWLRIRVRIARLLRRKLPLDALLDRIIREIQSATRKVTTRMLLTLRLPQNRTLRLGNDLSEAYPPALERLSNARLTALLQRIDPTPNSTRDSSALDWSELDERMHYICDLFRCYHEWKPLFEAPFTPTQVAGIKAGRRPDGVL